MRAFRSLSVGALFGAAVACNAVLGLDDVNLVEGTSGIGAAGGGGASSTAGSGGSVTSRGGGADASGAGGAGQGGAAGLSQGGKGGAGPGGGPGGGSAGRGSGGVPSESGGTGGGAATGGSAGEVGGMGPVGGSAGQPSGGSGGNGTGGSAGAGATCPALAPLGGDDCDPAVNPGEGEEPCPYADDGSRTCHCTSTGPGGSLQAWSCIRCPSAGPEDGDPCERGATPYEQDGPCGTCVCGSQGENPPRWHCGSCPEAPPADGDDCLYGENVRCTYPTATCTCGQFTDEWSCELTS